MATEQQLIEALRKADAAGDVPAAQAIAKRIKSMRAESAVPAKPQTVAPAQVTPKQDGFVDRAKQFIDYNVENYKALGTNVAHHLGNLPISLAQMQGDATQWVGGKLGVDNPRPALLNQAINQRQADYEADPYGAGNNTPGAWVGATAGEVAPWLAGPLSKATQAPVSLLKAIAPAKTGVIANTARGLAGAATQGAMVGGIAPVIGDGSRAENAQMGATVGVLAKPVGAAAEKIAKGGSEKISDMTLELYQKAKAMGIPVYAHQLTDSRVVKWLASMTKDIPFTGAGKATKQQIDSFTKATSNSIGQNTDEISPRILKDADTTINELYDKAYDGVSVKFDTTAANQYQALRKSLPGFLSPDKLRQFDSFAKNYAESIKGGKMPGKIYQDLRKTDFRKAINDNRDAYGTAIKDLRDIIDGAAKRSLPPERIAMHKAADTLYRNKKTVDKALSYSDTMDVKTRTEGKINPATFERAQGTKYPPTQEIADLGRIGQLIKDGAPNSGTVPRQMIGAGLLAGGGHFIPPGALATLISGIGAGRALNSKWLGKYVAEGMSKDSRKLATLMNKKAPVVSAASAKKKQSTDKEQ